MQDLTFGVQGSLLKGNGDFGKSGVLQAGKEIGLHGDGGHAVISHGYSRRTLDLDILIQRGEGRQWRDYVLGQGYTLLQESSNFFQCTASDRASWPLDFMLVSPETFARFKADAVSVVVQGVQVDVPSVQHLIALKLHAMKQGQRSRMFRDMDDVINLTRVAKIDLRSDAFKELCHNYGNDELYDYLLRARRQE